MKRLKLKYRKYQMTYCDYENSFVNINSILSLLKKHDTLELVLFCKKQEINYRILLPEIYGV